MPKGNQGRKARRIDLVTMYIRVQPKEHATIAKIVQKRGYPHNLSSVASEMISRGLASLEQLTPQEMADLVRKVQDEGKVNATACAAGELHYASPKTTRKKSNERL